MADLPPRLKTILESESHGAHTQHMTEVKTNIAHANNVLRVQTIKQQDELGPEESRAVAKVLALPK